MITLHTVTISRTTYKVYMGSNGNQYIFNVAETTQPKPVGGYADLNYLCNKNEFSHRDIESIIFKAERIMGKKVKENLAVSN